MPRETKAAKQDRFEEILRRLKETYPDAHCALNHKNTYELLVATILSAQCTDERVNKTTPALFAAYPDTKSLSQAEVDDIRELIKSINFLNNKAKFLKNMALRVENEYGGQIPGNMEDLLTLQGVSRKTANVVLSNAFGINEGVVVDTHVGRISQRMKLTGESDPKKIEPDLMKLCPQKDWGLLSHLFIDHGRALCKAPTPKCRECMFVDICPGSKPYLKPKK